MNHINLSAIALSLLLGLRLGSAAESGTNQAPANANPAPPTNAAPAASGGNVTNAVAPVIHAPVPAAATNAVAPVTNAPAPAAATNAVAPVSPSTAAATNGTAAAADPKPADHNIRFQFDGLPYADVVARFAQMVNKPLITDTKVEGTLTFNDPQPYAYSEALETLNLILSLKGVMLVESGRYLRLVPLKELTQMPLRIFRGLDHTGDATPGEVATVVLALKNLDASEIAPSISSMLSNAGSIAPLSRGRGLIVTDHLANIKRIQDLLTEVDTTSPVQRQMKSYTLLNASGAVLVDLINRTFGLATAPRRVEFNAQTKTYHQLPADVNDYVTAVFDEASRTLVLFGPADRVELAESLIKRFEDKSGVAAGEVKIFYPQSTSAQELARMLHQAMPSLADEHDTAAAAATKARLIVDGASNRLIVSAPAAGQLEEIEKLVQRIDLAPASGSGTNRFQDVQTTKVFRCRTADPESIVRILTDALVRPGYRSAGERPFRVILDANTKSIVLTGTPVDIHGAMEIVKQLDSEERVERLLRFIPVKTARPGDFTVRLRQLYQEQVQNLPDLKTPEALILPDDYGSRLILTATAGQLKLLEELIAQLDLPAEAATRQLKAITLKYTSANSITTMLMQLYGRQFRLDEPRLRVIATPSNDDKTILLEATTAMLERLEQVIRTLDVEPISGPFEVRTYQLTGANATEMVATLSRLFAERQDWQRHEPGRVTQPRFEADSASNTLIVAATKEQFTQIDQLIKELRASVEVATEIRTFKLKFCEPDQMVQLLDTMLHEQAPAIQNRVRVAPPGTFGAVTDYGKLRIAAAPALNAVVLQGPPDKLRLAEQLITTLDKEKIDPSSTIQTVHLKEARAEAVAQAVTTTLAGRVTRTPTRHATITPFTASNSLLIDGPSAEVEEVLRIIQDLDKESSYGNLEFHIYHVENAKAQDVSRILGQMIDGLARSQTARPGRVAQDVPVTMSIDDRSNSLIISATPESFKIIDRLLKQLDSAQPAQRTMHIVPVKSDRASDLATRLRPLYQEQTKTLPDASAPEALILPDDPNSRLILIATTNQLKLVEDLVTQLDLVPDETDRQLKRIPVMYTSANWIATMLQQLHGREFRTENLRLRVIVTAASDDRTLLLEAPTAMLERLEGTIRTLDAEPTRGAFEVRTYQLTGANATEMVATLSRLFAERQDWQRREPGPITQPRFEADSASNTLIVAATKEQFTQIDLLIKELRASVEVATEIRTFKLKFCEPDQMVQLLDTMLHEQAPAIQNRVRTAPPGTFGAVTDYGKLRIAAAPALNAVVVEGPPDKLRLAEQLITTLDKEKIDPSSTIQTVHLKEARAEAVAQAVTTTLAGRVSRTPTRHATITPFTASNSLLIDGPSAEVEEVLRIIQDLDKESSYGNLEFHIYHVENAKAQDVSRILGQMIDGLARSQTARPGRVTQDVPVTMSIDDRSNSLIISATPESFKIIDKLLKQLDSAQAVQRTMRIVPVKSDRAGDFATRVRPLYQEQAKSLPDASAPEAMILPDDANSRLILIATVAQLKLIEDLVIQLDIVPDETDRQLKRIPVTYTSANWIATMLQQLYARQFRAESPRLRIVATAATDDRTIVVEAPVAMFERLEAAIQTLDAEPTRGAFEVRTYQLTGANATEMAQTLSRLFAERQDWQKRAPGPVTQPRFEADPTSNTLIVAATKEQFTQIDQLVKEIRASIEVATEIRTFRLKFCDPDQMVQLLDTMLHEQTSTNQTRFRGTYQGSFGPVTDYGKLRIATAPALNAVVLQGPPDKLRLAEQLITTLDTEKTDPTATIRTVHLAKAQAEAVAEAVNKTLDSRLGRNQTRRTTVTPVTASNSLLIDGPSSEVEDVVRIIQDLDRESTNGNIEFHIYRIENGNAQEISRILGQMLEGLIKSKSHFARATRDVPVTMAVDDRSNSLIISASPDSFKLIDKLLLTLNQTPKRADRVMNLYSLVNADAFELAAKLQSLYADRPKDEQVSAEADSYSSTITVIARREDFPQIEEMIRRIDQAAVDNSIQVRMIALEKMPAAQMAAMLTNIYSQIAYGNVRLVERLPPRPKERAAIRTTPISIIATNPLAPTNTLGSTNETAVGPFAPSVPHLPAGGIFFPEVVIAVDKTANALLLSGPAHELDQIQTIIRDLTRAAASNDTELHLYALTEADPIIVARTLNELFRIDQAPGGPGGAANAGVGRGAGRRATLPPDAVVPGQPLPVIPPARVTVVAEPRTRSIIVRAQPSDFVLLEPLIKQLDVAGLNAQLGFRLVALENVQPDKLLPLATQMISLLRIARPGEPVTVTRDPRGHALFIVARNTVLDQVEAMIHELDTPANYAEAEVLLVPLKNANAPQLATILQGMLKPGTQAEVTVEARELQEQVRRLKIQNDRGEPIVLDLTKPIKILADPLPGAVGGANRLVMVSTADNLKALASVVAMMDTLPAMANIRIFPLHFAGAATLQRLLTELYAGPNAAKVRPEDRPSVTVDERTDALIVSGNEAAFAVVTNLLAHLDQEGTVTNGQIRIVPLKHVPAQSLSQSLTTLFAQRAQSARSPDAQRRRPVIIPDPRSNSLLIAATLEDNRAIDALLEKLDRQPENAAVSITVIGLRHNDAARVATMLASIFAARRQSTTAPGQPPVPQEDVHVEGDPLTNALIVSANPENLELVKNLLAQLDVAGLDTQLGFRLVALQNAQADKLLPLATQMISQLRIARPGEPVTVTGDPRGHALFVVARNAVLDQVEAMIHELDTPANYTEAEVLLVPLKNANAPQLATILQGMLKPGTQGELTVEARELQEQVRRLKIQNDRGEPIVLDLTKPIKILADPLPGAVGGANRLVMVSTTDNLKALASVVAMMDTLPTMANIRIFPLHFAEAATLQRLLTELYAGPNAAKVRPEDRPSVTVDERTGTLIVSGNEAAFAMVTNLLAHLDQEGTVTNGQIRIVPLKHVPAQSLSQSLTTLFAQRAQSARSPDTQRRRPVIIPDPRSNSLLIAATLEDNRAIDALLEKLDRQPENAAVSITVIGLRHNDAARVATMLASIFAARRQSTTAPGQPPVPQEDVHVESDPLTNALIITANPENLELARNLLAQIDVEPVVLEGLIQTFTLKQADATRASTMLRSLMDQGIYRPGILATGNRRSPRDAIAVTVDQRSNTLIISASPENLLVVKELIKQLDSQDYADSGDVRLFQLKHAKASQLATVLSQFFQAKRSGETATGTTERSVPVTVTPDDRTSTLLVTGGRETFAAVERMITQLDAEHIVPRTSFKVFPLKQATAAKLQSTLTQLFARRPATIRGETPDPITLVEDSWANALIVGATPEDLLMVESLITQLDNEKIESGLEVQVMPLTKADARQIAQTITTLYRSGGPGTTSPVNANVDERLNAVIVSAGASDIKRIAELVKKLDTDQVTQIDEIRVFTLTNARAVQLSALLTSVLNAKPTSLTGQSPSRQALLQFISQTEDGRQLLTSALKDGILISPDPRANSLVVCAPVEYMKLLQPLIARLDASSPQVATIKVFILKNADARQMMAVLTSLFHLQPAQPINQPTSNNRTIQYNLMRPAPEQDLGVPGPEEVAASATVGTAEENALTVAVDLRSNSLLVGGTEHYVALAEEIIETLDASPAQERKAEVYRLKNARALDIQAAVQNLLKQDAQLVVAAMGQQAMAEELLDRQATIVAETNSNTLLISATPRNFTQVKALVEQLDQPQRQVLIQVLLAEVTLTYDDELGVEWTYQSGGSPTTKTGTDFGLPAALQNFGGFSSALSGNNFNFLFRALQNEGRVQILSRPQILTGDNQLATIKVGQQVPIVTGSQVIATTGNNVNTFTYQDVGVTLTVTPRISPDGFVKMDVSPTITSLSSSTATVAAGFQVPIINQRLATTTVSVQSGQSILIGGLISTSDDTETKRIPLFGSIPYIGPLFRSTTKNTTRTELLILLTPQVLINGEAMATTNSALSVTREQLDRSTLKESFKKEPLEQQIFEPLFPQWKTNAPSATRPDDKSKAALRFLWLLP